MRPDQTELMRRGRIAARIEASAIERLCVTTPRAMRRVRIDRRRCLPAEVPEVCFVGADDGRRRAGHIARADGQANVRGTSARGAR